LFGLHLLSPWWFAALLLVPLVFWHGRRSLAGLSPGRRWTSMLLRMILVTAAVGALAEACWQQVSREVTAVYLLDISASIPREERQKVLDYVKRTSQRREEGGRRPDDRAGLVVFADGSSVELAPAENFYAPGKLHSVVDTEHSDIAEGLRMAAASFPAGARKRIVLVSDGAETRGLSVEEARRLAEIGVRVECLYIERRKQPEVMIERLVVRTEARAGEPVQVRAVLKADQPASGEIELYLKGQPAGKRRFVIGKGNKLLAESFEVRLPGPGFYPLEVRLRPDAGTDTIYNNNVGYAYTQLLGKARVLIIYSPAAKKDPTEDVKYLVHELRREKIEVQLVGPAAIPASNAELAGYDCVIIANVGAYAFTQSGMKAVRAAVRDMGVGLIMIGGPNSFGAGGYLNTPIEEALPVSCDVRQRKVMPNGALALIMHTCEMPKPNYWGRRISHAAVNVLSPQDEVGLIIYDWQAGCRWLFKIQPAGPGRAKMHALIKKAQPGDMPDFDTSMNMALKGLKKVKAALKHCIIISDGDPSLSDPLLLAKFKKAKITVSTVAIAPEGPGCIQLMRRIARITGGRAYAPKNANMLPQIFIKEAMTVRRSVIFTHPFTPRLEMATDPVKGFLGVKLPQLEGYVVTTAKDRAEVPLTVKLKDGMTDPVLAHWRYGEGKAVAFTSSATSDWAPKWIGWPGYVKFWAQLVRWTSRAGGTGDLQVKSEIKGGRGRIVVEAIDENGRLINHLDLKGHVTDPKSRAVPGINLVQTAPGRYEAEFTAGPPGAYQINVFYKDSSGAPRNHTSGVANSYSPEFGKLKSSPGLLRDIARVTGGEMLSWDVVKDREVIWARNLPPGHRIHPGWEWLLWIILILFPIDVAVRRVMLEPRHARIIGSILAGVVQVALFYALIWHFHWAYAAVQLIIVVAGAYLFSDWLKHRQLQPAAAGVPDPTIAALMAEKERLRSDAPAPATEDVRSRFLDQLKQAHASSSGTEDQDALQEMLKRHKDTFTTGAGAAAAKKPARKAPKPTGISGYAGALLDAKKRALKDKDKDTDKGKDKKK
jgi:uncharacterized membrane protein